MPTDLSSIENGLGIWGTVILVCLVVLWLTWIILAILIPIFVFRIRNEIILCRRELAAISQRMKSVEQASLTQADSNGAACNAHFQRR